MKQYILILLFALGMPVLSFSQDCSTLYKQALEKYQEGDVQAAYDLLQNCFTERKLLAKAEKDIKADLYWLGTQSSILLKKNKKAKAYLKKMLALRPYYKTDKDDLQDVGNMMQGLVVKPRLSMTIMAGLTGSHANLDRSYDVFVDRDDAFSARKDYRRNPQIGIMAGVDFQFTINRQVSIGFGTSISQEKYRYKYKLDQETVDFDIDEVSNNVFDTFQVQTYSLSQQYDHEQDLTYIKFPLSIKLHPIQIGRFEPYAEVGGYYGFLIGANKIVNIKEIDSYTVESQSTSLEQTEILEDFFTTNIKNMMVVGTYGGFFGTGINIKIHRTNLQLGARFQFGFNNIVRQEARYNFEDLTYDFYDIMDDVRINSGQVFIGWSIPLTFKAFERNPKKVRKNKIKQ